MEHLAAHGAEEEATEPSHAASSDDDERRVGSGRIEHSSGRQVAHGLSGDGDAVTDSSNHEVVEHLVGDRCRVVRVERDVTLEVVLVDVPPRHDRGDGFPGERGVVDGPAQRRLGVLGFVDPDDDAFHDVSVRREAHHTNRAKGPDVVSWWPAWPEVSGRARPVRT